jgi:hypothetical protein
VEPSTSSSSCLQDLLILDADQSNILVSQTITVLKGWATPGGPPWSRILAFPEFLTCGVLGGGSVAVPEGGTVCIKGGGAVKSGNSVSVSVGRTVRIKGGGSVKSRDSPGGFKVPVPRKKQIVPPMVSAKTVLNDLLVLCSSPPSPVGGAMAEPGVTTAGVGAAAAVAGAGQAAVGSTTGAAGGAAASGGGVLLLLLELVELL